MCRSRTIEAMKKNREYATLNDAAVDPLWKMEMMSFIGLVIAQWSIRLSEFEIKYPDKDITERRTEIELLEEVELWMTNLWERTLQEYRLNTHLTLQNLKLQKEIEGKDKYISKLQKELKDVKENIKDLQLK